MWSFGPIGYICLLLTCALLCQKVSYGNAGQIEDKDHSNKGKLRILLEDFVFIKGETDIIKGIIDEESGIFELGGVAKTKKDQGLSQAIPWDYLVTNRNGAKKIFRNLPLRPDQTVSVTPGMDAITQKNTLIKSLWSAYGEKMSDIMPLTFALPEGLGMLKHYVEQATPEQLEEVWVLKENKHRGRGITPVLLKDILPSIMTNYVTSRHQQKSNKKTGKYVLAQKFISKQMLIDDIPFTFRIWTIFGGGLNTSRGYLFDGSIVPFGDKPFVPDTKKSSLSQANDLIVNLFLQDRSKAKDPWSMHQLKEYLQKDTGSDDAFDRIWDTVRESIAKTLVAAIPNVKKTVKGLKYYQGGNFEILGIDFILDSNRKPWLIEVNYLPSMARKVIGCVKGSTCSTSVFDTQKEKLLYGMLHILSKKHNHIDTHLAEAEKAISQNTGCSLPAGMNANILAQISDMLFESETASAYGFSSLNKMMYDAMIFTQERRVGKFWQVLESLQRKLRLILPSMPIVQMDYDDQQGLDVDRLIHDILNKSPPHGLRPDQILELLCNQKAEL
jgi:hypothetical protein